ncbi:MAG: kelch repeat-containing protein, partial [Bacteroidota bacterium]
VSQGILLAGGADETGQVHDTARLVTESGFVFAFGSPIALGSRRTGHTGTRLGDGRALLLGGTSDLTPEGTTDFVTQAEVIDPTTRTVRPVVFRDGSPVRRTGHTVALLDRNDRQFLYVIGGREPSGNGLTTSSSVDILEFRPGTAADTLVVLSPASGASGPAGLPDATQILLAEQPNLFTALLTGLPSGATPEAQRVRYEAPGTSFPFRIEPAAVAAPPVPRTGADGVRLGFGLGLLAGGSDASGSPLATLDVYSDRAGRFFRTPPGVQLGFGRRDHTVTLAPSGRILVAGGRNANGQALQTVEVISF